MDRNNRKRVDEWDFAALRRGARHVLMGSVALGLLALPGLAQAQGNNAATDADPAPTGDIVVTATRQESTINKVPLSIAAFSKEALDVRGVRQVDDVFRLTPGVTFGRGLTGVTGLSIRGIASGSGAATTGVYIDDSPIQTRSIGFNPTTIYPAVFDLERVEVLRGPQGTLFGAGSEGGTVRFITSQPSLSKTSVYGRAELATTEGGDQSYEAGVAVNVPVSDTIAVRMSAWHRRDGGYIDHISRTTGNLLDKNSDWQDTTALRAAILFQPIEELKITASLYYQRIFQNDQQAYTEYVSDPDNGVYNNNLNAASPFRATYRLPALNVSYDAGPVTVTGNVSYFDQDNIIHQDYGDFLATLLGGTVTPATGIPGFPGYYNQTFFTNSQKIWTGELRMSSNNGTWINWTVGTFYQHQNQTGAEYLPEQSAGDFDRFVRGVTGFSATDFFGPVPLVDGIYSYVSDLRAKESQFAVFGETTITPIDHIKIILGGRYSHNNFTYDTRGYGPYAGAAMTTATGTQKQWSFTPKAGIEYEFNDRNRLYFTASKGFRPGGANNQLAARCGPDLAAIGLTQGPSSYNSDTVWSYELGTKNRFLGNKLSINASVYKINWDGIQQSIYLPLCGGDFVSNLGKATSKGFDLEAEVRPTTGLLLQFAAGYNKSVYTESILAGPNAAGVRAILVNKGDSLGNTPWQFTVAGQYDFPILDHDFYIRGDYQFSGRETRPTPNRDPLVSGYSPQYIPTPDQNYMTARVGMKTDGIEVSAFVNNLLNDNPKLGHLQFGAAGNLINQIRTLRPRTFGVTLTYRH